MQSPIAAHRSLADIPGAENALAFLGEAYRRRLRRPGKTIEHPIAVATLLADDGRPPPVVIAGILHDVLEDTSATPVELADAVGVDVARWVQALTEDPSIRKYRKRKSALRQQIVDAGPAAAAVSLADKVAKLQAVQSRPPERKLDHYRKTLQAIERHYGSSALSALLREELTRWRGG